MKYSKDDIAIIVALEEELPETILPEFKIFYSGVGKINATLKTAEVIYKTNPKLVINYGSAGALNKNLSGLHQVTSFFQRDMDVTGLGFMRGETPFEDDIPLMLDFGITEYNNIKRRATCGSGDSFVEDRTQYYGEVVDMEAYALAKVCYLYDVPFISFKYITDGADEQAHEDWEANLADGIVEFKEKVLKELK